VYHSEDEFVEVLEVEVAKVSDVLEQLFLLENDAEHVLLVSLDLVVVWQVVVLQKVLHVHVGRFALDLEQLTPTLRLFAQFGGE
jgi:hypothetical protein